MSTFREILKGVFAPVTTPFKNDKPDLEALRKNLDALGKTELTGYLALGSNGEFQSLNETEELHVLEVFAAAKGSKVVMVGTGCESTDQTLNKIGQAAALGFELASVLTPHYFVKQITPAALEAFYIRLAEESPLPIVLYNAPGFAGGVSLSPALLSQLSAHTNIAGIKDSSKEGPAVFLSRLAQQTDFAVLAGSTNFFYPALHLGAVGGVLSLGNYLPEPCCDLFSLYHQGAFKEALPIHHRLARINRAVSGPFGVAGVKCAMDLMGFAGGAPRHPLQKIDAQQQQQIKTAIEQEGFNCVG